MHFQSLAVLALTTLTIASPTLFSRQNQATCATCNPTSGLDQCDASTSCISTGQFNYCACRAGYKAANLAHEDPNIQFRLTAPQYENRVFVPTGQSCDVLCDDPFAPLGPTGQCSEVILTTCADT